ncbi:MAG: diacylglycerol/polyprenol kinase family protein [Bacteroidota bacterium]
MTEVPSGNPPEGHDLGQLEHSATIEYRHELVRKAIHLTSLSIPVIYYFISRSNALWLLVPVTAAFVIVDVARYYFPPVTEWFYSWFGWLLRRREQDSTKKRLNGATNVLISACLCVLLFPKIITVTAFAILIISDSTSALIGRRFGKHRFFDKSLEGSIAFFISAIVVVLLAPKVTSHPLEYVIGVVAAAFGAVVESLSIKIDDNISIPLVVGLVMWGLYAVLLPAVSF